MPATLVLHAAYPSFYQPRQRRGGFRLQLPYDSHRLCLRTPTLRATLDNLLDLELVRTCYLRHRQLHFTEGCICPQFWHRTLRQHLEQTQTRDPIQTTQSSETQIWSYVQRLARLPDMIPSAYSIHRILQLDLSAR